MIKGSKASAETRLKMRNSKLGVKFSDEHRKNLSKSGMGKKLSDRTKEKIRLAKLGKPAHWQVGEKNHQFGKHPSAESLEKMRKAQLGRTHSPETKLKMSLASLGKKKSPEQVKKMSENMIGKMAGDKHHNWQGGITKLTQAIRNSREYKFWRSAVFGRDDFTCQKTGQIGGALRAHHINNFSNNPLLRTSITNGITLSKASHEEFHRLYGIKNNTLKQLQEYLNK